MERKSLTIVDICVRNCGIVIIHRCGRINRSSSSFPLMARLRECVSEHIYLQICIVEPYSISQLLRGRIAVPPRSMRNSPSQVSVHIVPTISKSVLSTPALPHRSAHKPIGFKDNMYFSASSGPQISRCGAVRYRVDQVQTIDRA